MMLLCTISIISDVVVDVDDVTLPAKIMVTIINLLLLYDAM